MRSRQQSSGVPSPERYSPNGTSVVAQKESQEQLAAPNGTFGKDHAKLLSPRVVQRISNGVCGLGGAAEPVAAAGACVGARAGIIVVADCCAASKPHFGIAAL
jgi:hypothetical protein